MKKRQSRLEKLEQLKPEEPVFSDWFGYPWTPEQKAEVMRKHPGSQMFWHSLCKPTQYFVQGDNKPHELESHVEAVEWLSGSGCVDP